MHPDSATAGATCGDGDRCTGGYPTAAPAITTTASVSGNTIVIQNMAYNPAQITVKAGSIVRWVNKDTVPHSVVFTDPAIPSSGILAPGQAYASVILNCRVPEFLS